MNSFFRAIVRFLIRYYPLVLLAGLVLVALSWPRMAHLFKNISTDPADLLPRDYVSVERLLDIREKVDAKKRFGVVFESDNPENTKRLLKDLKPILEALPSVGRAYIEKPGYDFMDRNKFLYMELEDLEEIRDRIDRKIQQEKLGGFYISFEEGENGELQFSDLEEKYRARYGEDPTGKYYTSPNGRVFALYVESQIGNPDMAQEKRFQDEVKKKVEAFDFRSYDPTMKLYFGGSSRIMEYRALIRDLKIAGIISGILIFLPLLIRFRRPHYVLLIFSPLLISVPSGIALASIWVPRLNVTTSFLFAILGGLGVETGIHIFSRYYLKRKEGASIEEALLDMYLFLGKPVLTAVAALATTFLLISFSDFRGFSQFGFISGVGLWTVFLLYFTFFPALLIFAERVRILKFKKRIREFQWRLALSPGFVKTVVLIFSLFTVFSLIITPHIKFEYNFKKIRADDPRDRISKLKQRLTTSERVNSPAMVMVQNEEEAELLKNTVHSLRDRNPDTVIDYTTSLFGLVPTRQEEKLKVLREIRELLSDDSIRLVEEEKRKDLDRFKLEIQRPRVFTGEEVPEDVKKMFRGKEGVSETLFLIFAKPHLELDDGRNALAFAKEIGEIGTPQKTFHPSSSAIVFADVLSTMFRDSKKILIIAVLSILFFVYLDFRNWKKSGLIMFSILSGIFWVMGIMYFLHIKMNLYNMVMIPAVMGMSVDNSIHVFHSYEELGPGSLPRVLSSTGVAALLASLTNAAGFVGLAFCTHGGLRSMGQVAVIGVVTCLVTTLVFLPMILQLMEKRKPEKGELPLAVHG